LKALRLIANLRPLALVSSADVGDKVPTVRACTGKQSLQALAQPIEKAVSSHAV
jgi:hypothetical protein